LASSSEPVSIVSRKIFAESNSQPSSLRCFFDCQQTLKKEASSDLPLIAGVIVCRCVLTVSLDHLWLKSP
jgi:hypothetical protein